LVEPTPPPVPTTESLPREFPAGNERDKAAARNRAAHRVSSEQVSQIADYLRRKRDELEAENAELAISTWQQQQVLQLQRESLRQNLTAIRRLNSLTEKMRCELIELGHCLVDAFDGNDSLIQQFSQLCETYAEIAAQTKLVRAA
jgi:acyl-CoA reductase-like NAD-dependent aldehyde dehydrogenase